MLSAKQKRRKRSSRVLPEVNPHLKKKKREGKKCLFKGGASALSVTARDPIAVRGRLLQLVVLEAVKGGSVTL